MVVRTALVVGAGVAGSTVAVLLARGGVATTLVELADDQRSSGGPVDVRGAAVAVVDRMGLLEPLRAAATRATRLALVDGGGRVIGWIPTQVSTDALEIARSDLASILVRAAGDDVDIVYGDTVSGLADDGAGVDVTFVRSAPARFDLVIAADGLHSRVRQLVFGPEERFVTSLGMSIATVPLGTTASDAETVFLHSQPGRAALIHPTTGREGAAFIFRHGSAGGERDPRRRADLLASRYGGMRWRVPEMLDRVRQAEDVYYDSIDRVHVGAWSRGRIVLVGDAAGCVTVFGEGSSMAIVGAATLAEAISAGTDLSQSLRAYEQAHRKRSASRQRGAGVTSHFLVPHRGLGVHLRNTAFRLWPVVDVNRRRYQRAP